jgi:DNA mismatch repair ATPase MutL
MELEQLDGTTANTIQASYRVTSVARMIDEMIFNSLQASADYIEIHLALPSIVEIRDNGTGIRLAQLTQISESCSKSSLFYISMLADLTIVSKSLQDPCYKLTLQHSPPRPSSSLLKPGTVIRLSNIYSRLPVRRYEISSPSSIVSSTKDLIYRYSLLHSDTSFKLYSYAEVISCYPACKDISSRLKDSIPYELKEIQYSGRYITLRGFISDIFHCIPHSKEQHLYIYSRPVFCQLIEDCIKTAYSEVLSSEMVHDDEKHRFKYPVYVIELKVEGEVEIIPSGEKLEVNFGNKYGVGQDVYRAIEKFLDVRLERKGSEFERTDKKHVGLKLDFKKYTFCSEIDDDELVRKCDQGLELHKAKRLKTEKKDFSSMISSHLLQKPLTPLPRSPPQPIIPLIPPKPLSDLMPASLQSYTEQTSLEFSVPDYLHQTSSTIEISSIKSCRVIGLIQNEFILVMTPDETVIIVDQHAAHERVRLEKFETEVLSHISATHCDEFLALSDRESLLIKNSEDYIKRWSFEYKHIRNGIQLSKVPKVFETVLQPHEILLLCDSRDSIPDPIHRVLKSKACKGAIKFGDSISASQASQIMKELSECRQAFFCAHGRPSVHALHKGLLKSGMLPYPKLIR